MLQMAYFGKAATGPGNDSSGIAPPGVPPEVLREQQKREREKQRALAEAARKAHLKQHHPHVRPAPIAAAKHRKNPKKAPSIIDYIYGRGGSAANAKASAKPRKPPVPAAEPLMRWHVINELLARSASRTYLEIGVQHGHCGAKVYATEKWGVDPDPKPGCEKHYTKLTRQSSDDFFRALDSGKRFDVIFIDGLHHADQTLRDVQSALRHLADGGTIVLHDCNPQNELAQRVPRESRVWNGDVWKAAAALRSSAFPELDCFVVDTDQGLGIVRRGTQQDEGSGTTDALKLDYSALESGRSRILGLTKPAHWKERYGPPFGPEKIVIASAVYGARDTPRAAPSLARTEFVLFTDDSALRPKGWQQRVERLNHEPRKNARRIKTLLHRYVADTNADVLLWIDGRIASTGKPLASLVQKALAHAPIASYPHPWRGCAYDEANECVQLGLADAQRMKRQIAAYQKAGFPRHLGLYNTMVVARTRSTAAEEIGERWWREIELHSERDQVSLPFVLWSLGQPCGLLGGDVYNSNAHFLRGSHTG